MNYRGDSNVLGAGGGDFFGVGARDIFFHAAAVGGFNVGELDGHALAGINSADHATYNHRFAGIEGETQFDGFTEMEGMRIEKIEAAGGKIADVRNGRNEFDGDGFAKNAGLESAISLQLGHTRGV